MVRHLLAVAPAEVMSIGECAKCERTKQNKESNKHGRYYERQMSVVEAGNERLVCEQLLRSSSRCYQ